ncbi:hypothetical protein KSP40_PGU004744 [Platanthera guangdongensis]|uniref:Uncharacterized protein n=1 Tax=Platanthera guangdongensis TaxID=2320717 RepID=A0ABR2MPH1_9ASPA
MSISPSLSTRQCPDRYAFRVGRNLPNKEFRYLRTVIVMVAIHRASVVGSPVIRSPTSLTFRHWAGVSPHTWSYDFAETCLFGKQSPGLGHRDTLSEEAPILSKLRGYFAEFLRESCLAPLGILYLPTCVGFGYRYPFVEGRSSIFWEYGMGYFSAVAPGTRTLDRGISSTPFTLKKQAGRPEAAGSPATGRPGLVGMDTSPGRPASPQMPAALLSNKCGFSYSDELPLYYHLSLCFQDRRIDWTRYPGINQPLKPVIPLSKEHFEELTKLINSHTVPEGLASQSQPFEELTMPTNSHIVPEGLSSQSQRHVKYTNIILSKPQSRKSQPHSFPPVPRKAALEPLLRT